MLNAVIRAALRYRAFVVAVSLAVLIYGGYAATTLPIDVFPDLDRPRVVVMTEAEGLAPEEVETLVTFPLESALLGASGVQDVRSQSGFGLSVIYVEFDWETDIRNARQVVQERLATTQSSMPAGIRPQMAPMASIMGQVVLAGLHRRMGPHGGELSPIGETGKLAELIHDRVSGKVQLYLLEPRDRDHPENWLPVESNSTEVVLSWAEPPENLKSEQGTAVAPPLPRRIPYSEQRLSLRPSHESSGEFLSNDPRLQLSPGRVGWVDLERKAAISLNGRTHDAIFGTKLQRDLELRSIADWIVRPRLLKVPGLAQVAVMGGGRKQYQIEVDPVALQAYNVTLQQVEEALRGNNANSSGGFAVRGGTERPIRIIGRLGPDTDQVLSQLRQVPVRPGPGRTVQLAQVARVMEGAQVKRGDAGINGHPAVVLTIVKQPHVDTRAITDQISGALSEVAKTLTADVVVNSQVFRMRDFIDRGVSNVGEALGIGALLVLIILLLFLLNVRTTFISLAAIPLSLAVTALVFKAIGWLSGSALSINVMTLGGIAVAMGELVDDAIVDVENIFRRLRENNAAGSPQPAIRVIYEASVEVRGAIVFGTAMVILVFIPLFALSGMEGRLFAPLGVAYIVSILASLIVSLTVTPVLSYYLLPQARAAHRTADSPLLRLLKWAASFLVRFSMARAGLILVATWLLVALAGWQLSRLGADFLPPFDEGNVQIDITLPPNSSLEASNEACAVVDARLRTMQISSENPHGAILQFARRTGRAELDEHAEPVSNSEYIVSINPAAGRTRAEIIREIQDGLKDELAGADVEVEQPLAHLISHVLSGVSAQIAIKVNGDDLGTLRQSAERIKAAVANVKGISTPVIEPQRQVEELHIRLRPDRLALYGVDRIYVSEFLTTALKGEAVSEVVQGQRRFDLVVRLDESSRTDYAGLGRLVVELPGNRGPVALKELADIGDGTGASQVNRENARRRIVVRVNATGRDLASVVADIRRHIDREVQPSLPPGYFIEYGGQFDIQRRATRLIAILAAVSVVGMFVVLWMLYPSTRIILQILNALPAAFIGGVIALTLTGQTLTVAAMVGFISLGGIAARNGILLVSHYFHLMRHEGESFTPGMVMRGSLERLSPVLMTALTAGLGLAPLVIGGRQPGREILYPVATVILGGLITSTLCEFLLHPGLFWNFSGRDAERLMRDQNEAGELAHSAGQTT